MKEGGRVCNWCFPPVLIKTFLKFVKTPSPCRCTSIIGLTDEKFSDIRIRTLVILLFFFLMEEGGMLHRL